MVIVAIPAEEFRVVTVLQDELLASEVRVIKADPSSTLHTDGVHSVHKASVLEVVTVPKDLQLPPCEMLALIESDLEQPGESSGSGSHLTYTHILTHTCSHMLTRGHRCTKHLFVVTLNTHNSTKGYVFQGINVLQKQSS